MTQVAAQHDDHKVLKPQEAKQQNLQYHTFFFPSSIFFFFSPSVDHVLKLIITILLLIGKVADSERLPVESTALDIFFFGSTAGPVSGTVSLDPFSMFA